MKDLKAKNEKRRILVEGALSWQSPLIVCVCVCVYIYIYAHTSSGGCGTIRPIFGTTYLKCSSGRVPLQVVRIGRQTNIVGVTFCNASLLHYIQFFIDLLNVETWPAG